MALIGWIVCVAFMMYISAIAAITAWNTLGQYNIGGAPNKPDDKIATVVFIVIVLVGWWLVALFTPFTVSLK